MNVLSIQSWVTCGHVGNAAAMFPLQRLGTEVWAVHTVQFSNHPGHGDFAGRVSSGAEIGDIVAALDRRGVLARCDAVLSGYVGDASVADAVLDAVLRVRAANPDALYCCDPVIGDGGRIYVRETIPALIAERLLPQADLLTPNQFELEHLTGAPIETRRGARDAIGTLRDRLRPGPRALLVTSLSTRETPPDRLDVVSADGRGMSLVQVPRLAVAASGAGDAMAALFLHHYMVSGRADLAMALAAGSMHGVLRRTAETGADDLALIAAQDEIEHPTLRLIPESF